MKKMYEKTIRVNCVLSFLLALMIVVGLMPISAITASAATISLNRPLDKAYTITAREYYSSGTYHGAIDYGCPKGTPVYAAESGTVTVHDGGYGDGYYGCKDGSGWGNYIDVSHGNGYSTRYAHMTAGRFVVTTGASVKKGQLIGYSGNSGNSTGAHLHFGLYLNGTKVYPESYIKTATGYFSSNSSYANLGTGFTAPVLNKEHWKIIENNNGTVKTANETGTSNQLWYFERQSDGSYKISSCYDGRCLDVANASNASGVKVGAVTSNNSNAQRWYIYEEAGGYILKAKCTDCVLDLPNNDPTNGNQLQMYTKNGTGAQVWAIYRGAECVMQPPTLSVSPGKSTTKTTFTWNNVYGETGYHVKIWKGTVWEGDAYHVEWDTSSGYGIQLPAGTYQAYVDASNYFETKMSNVVTFTVTQPAPTIDTRYPTPFRANTRLWWNTSDGRTPVYDAVNGNQKGYIYNGYNNEDDHCTIEEVYTNGWCKVTVPGLDGARYCQLSVFVNVIDGYNPWWVVSPSDIDGYRRWDHGSPSGYIAKGDNVCIISETESMYQTIYPGTNGNVSRWVDRCLLAHMYTNNTTAPNCTAQGYTTHTCKFCGYSYKDTYVNATGHSYSYAATKNPTTSATGTLTGTCSKCKGTTTVTLPKLNTTDYTYAVKTAATCTVDGTATYTWKTTTYGNFSFSVKLTKTGHSYSYAATKNPTTSATGTLTGTCSKCKGTTTVILPKLNTTDYTYAVKTAATCTADGTGTYTWKTTTYGNFSFNVTLTKTGHSYSYAATKNPTTSATGTLTGTCSKCKGTTTVTLPKLTTTDYTYAVKTAATCTADGTGTYTWKTTTYGNFSFNVTLTKTGHSYSYAATKNPTTSATGTLTGTCSKCKGTTTVTLPKLTTTDYTYAVKTAATCTADGTGTYTWKTTTYGNFSFNVTLAKTGHSYSYAATKNPATSTTGTLTGTCSKCKGTTTVTLPKLNTTDYTYAVKTAATCTADGTGTYTWKTTTYGNFSFNVTLTKTGHSYSYAATKNPTTSATGTLTGTCSKCKGTTTVTLPKLNTTDYTYAVKTAATCTADGTATYTWKTTTYGSFGFNATLNKAGHSFASGLCTVCGEEDPDYLLTIAYNANGGTGAPASQTKISGTMLTLSNVRPTRFGYNFIGWAASSSATTAVYQPGGKFTTDANTTLYAVWSAAETISTTTETIEMPQSKYGKVGYYYKFTPTVSTSYRLNLLDSDEEGVVSITLYDSDKNGLAQITGTDTEAFSEFDCTLEYAATSDKTYYLYLEFTDTDNAYVYLSVYRGYFLSYNAKGGSNAPSKQYFYYGNGYHAISSEVPTRTGYTFIAWNTTSDGSGNEYHPGDKLNEGWTNTTLYAIWEKGCPNSHNYCYSVTEKPTTSVTGNLAGICVDCSSTTTVTLPKLTTTDYTYAVKTAATCTADGTGTYTWKTTTYGNFSFNVTLAKTGHSYSYTATKNPTTSVTGTLTGTCSKCKGTTTVTMPKLNTTDYTYAVKTAATCTADGTATYTWKTTTYGNFSFNVTLAKTGHSYSYAVTEQPTTLTTGTVTGTCSKCGSLTTVILPMLNKTDYTYAVKMAASCTADGIAAYTWQTTTYGSFSFNVTLTKTGHSYSYAATKNPTTSVTGTLTGTCSKCNGTTTVTLPKLNTTDYTYAVKAAATCTTDGTGTYAWKTTTYGNFSFNVTLTKTGHNYSYAATKNPTTSTSGTLTGTCSKCKGTTTVTLPKLTTTDYTYAVKTAATCTADGTGTYTWKTTTYGSFSFDVTLTKIGHSYENGSCATCGASDPNYIPGATKPILTLKSPTLEFKDMICINAFYTAENTQDVVEMGMITYDEKVTSPSVDTADHVIPGATYNADTGRYVSSSQGIHAKYLGDTIYLAVYAKLKDGSYAYSKLAPYSAVTYANNQLKNSADVKLKKLVAAMLNYGAEAQLYFGHNTGNLANAALTADQKALPDTYRADMINSVPAASAAKQGIFANNSGFASRKPAISFEGAFCINYFFTPKYAPTSGITLYYWNEADYNAADVLTTANATGKIKLDGSGTGEYRGDITGIAAKNLSGAVYVAAAYKNGSTVWTSGVLGYSIGTYCSSQVSKGGTIAELAKTTAVYGYHAKQYFG